MGISLPMIQYYCAYILKIIYEVFIEKKNVTKIMKVAKWHKYSFSGESEILQTSGRGKNNVYFQQPVSDRLLSQDFAQAVDGHSVTSVRPYFSTKGTIYRVKIGSSVTMACEIINLGKYIT